MIILFDHLNKKDKTHMFKEVVSRLFSDMMNIGSLNEKQREQLARLRSRVEIELKDFK